MKVRNDRFSVALMNPPYNKNLHLKFIRKCIEFGDYIVNISPIRWLQDPFANDKRSTLKQYKDVAKHIKNIDIAAKKEFKDIAMYADLGIYVLTSNETNFDYGNFWKTSLSSIQVNIIKKCCYSKCKKLGSIIQHSNCDKGIYVPLSLIAGGRGCLPTIKNYDVIENGLINGKQFIDVWNEDPRHKAFPLTPNKKILCVKFNTIEEAKNFYDSYQYFKPLKGLCKLTQQQQHIQSDFLPVFNDYSNPIDENFFQDFFGLSKDEMEELNKLGDLKYNESL